MLPFDIISAYRDPEDPQTHLITAAMNLPADMWAAGCLLHQLVTCEMVHWMQGTEVQMPLWEDLIDKQDVGYNYLDHTLVPGYLSPQYQITFVQEVLEGLLPRKLESLSAAQVLERLHSPDGQAAAAGNGVSVQWPGMGSGSEGSGNEGSGSEGSGYSDFDPELHHTSKPRGASVSASTSSEASASVPKDPKHRSSSTLHTILDRLGVAHLIPTFEKEGVDSVETALELDDDDLKTGLGVEQLVTRVKLRKALGKAKRPASASSSSATAATMRSTRSSVAASLMSPFRKGHKGH